MEPVSISLFLSSAESKIDDKLKCNFRQTHDFTFFFCGYVCLCLIKDKAFSCKLVDTVPTHARPFENIQGQDMRASNESRFHNLYRENKQNDLDAI